MKHTGVKSLVYLFKTTFMGALKLLYRIYARTYFLQHRNAVKTTGITAITLDIEW